MAAIRVSRELAHLSTARNVGKQSSEFGMGSGVTLPLWPKHLLLGSFCRDIQRASPVAAKLQNYYCLLYNRFVNVT